MTGALNLFQYRLARIALGEQDAGRPTRNQYFTSTWAEDTVQWRAMVDAGLAYVQSEDPHHIVFALTERGLSAALVPGETIRPLSDAEIAERQRESRRSPASLSSQGRAAR